MIVHLLIRVNLNNGVYFELLQLMGSKIEIDGVEFNSLSLKIIQAAEF